MSGNKWREILTIRLESASWGRVLWILAVAILGGWAVYVSPDFLESRERHFFDFMQAYYKSSAPRVSLTQIVAGDRSMQAIGQWPWSRKLHAQLLERLTQSRLVLLDMLFSNPSTPEEDQALIAAVRKHGNVIGNSYLISSLLGNIVQPPFPELHDAFRRVGLADLARDTDSIYRKGIWGLESSDKTFTPSLALVALEELEMRTFPFIEQNNRLSVQTPWKTMPLHRSAQGFIDFWINHPPYEIPTYEYIDVLNSQVPESVFKGALVIVGYGGIAGQEDILVAGNRTLSRAEYVLHTVASMMGSFAPRRISPAQSAVLTAFLVITAATVGFIHFKKSLVFLVFLFLFWGISVFALFLKWSLWLPVAGPLLASFLGYIGSQIMLGWRLNHEWNVRSLSIKPLLALAQRADTDLDRGINFDEYLRSLWNEIEEKTGVILKSTRINENISLIQSYLQRAQKTSQQGQDNFLIIRNASDTSPRHRMLLPLPAWSGQKKDKVREYVILAWDGKIPMETLTSLAALTLFAAVHFYAQEEGRRRKDMLFKTIEAIMMAVEAKDHTTSEHSRRVASLSKKLAEWMHLSSQEVEDIYFSAIIHDIGKLGISDSILKKPSMLTEEELAEMQRHPTIGEDIMRPVELPDYVISGIMQHHERHDGKGYPYGLQGGRVTMAGKIIKVADVFDALVNRRQYKEAWTQDQVREFLMERRGTEFDPQVVDVFLKHLYQEGNNPLIFGV